MTDEMQRRIGWGYGYGAGYVDALRGRPANNVAPPDGRAREGDEPTEPPRGNGHTETPEDPHQNGRTDS